MFLSHESKHNESNHYGGAEEEHREPTKINDIFPKNTFERRVDISLYFPISKFSIENQENRFANEDIGSNRFEYIILKKPLILSVSKLKKIEFLDIAESSRYIPSLWKMFFRGERIRGKTIDLTPPISVPYGTIDLRPMQRIRKEKTHPDIYSQKLPLFYKLRRTYYYVSQNTYRLGVAIAMFLVCLAFFSLPLKWFLESSVVNAYMSMKSFHFSSPKLLAKEAIEIRGTFEKARLYFFPFNVLFNNPLIRNEKVLMANAMIAGGLKMSHAIDMFARSLPTDQKDDFAFQVPGTIFPFEKVGIEKPTEWMKANKQYLQSIVEDIDIALLEYSAIDSLGIKKYDEKFRQVKALLAYGAKYGHFFMDHFDEILIMLGDREPQRYIVLNQNRDEIRANGGFPGTVITVNVYKGNIVEYRKDDVYYYDWHLFPNKETPPPGLDKIADNFGVRDVNYYPEFRKTVEKANYFIEKAGASSITTMIAINQGIIMDLLKKYGPVRLDEIGQDITGEDFSFLMSVLVEAKFGKIEHPKEILFSFIDNFIQKLLEKQDFAGYAEILERNFMSGEILIASRNEQVQSFIESFHFYEQWKGNDGNWIYPVFTSISGNKSDRYINRTFSLSTTPSVACTVENTIRINSTHTFDIREEKRVRGILKDLDITDKKQVDELVQIQGMGENRQYIRLLIPPSSLLTTTGADISVDSKNFAYTTLSLYLDTPVGKSVEKSISYLTKIENCNDKDLTLQFFRQPGLTNITVLHTNNNSSDKP